MTTTDTPRTDACPHCGAEIYSFPNQNDEITYWRCGSACITERGYVRSYSCYQHEIAALKAEVKQLNNILENTRESRADIIELRNILDQELSHSLKNQCKANAKVKEIRGALGDDGRRTHKEILEMAFKASGWKIWQEKYLDLKNAHIAEGQDPAGTIWEHADKLQKQLKRAVEIAEMFSQVKGLHCQCNCRSCQMLAELKREIK